MIRFIYIGDQIDDWATDFAFFDTVKDQFITIAGEQVFSDPQDFIRTYRQYYPVDNEQFQQMCQLIPSDIPGWSIKREE